MRTYLRMNLALAALASTLVIAACQPTIQAERAAETEISYEIDITQPADDLFHVTVRIRNLGPDNDVYNFAATAPGTYSILDFGRFVRSLKGFDVEGTEIPVEQISTNRWHIAEPERLVLLRYDVEDTFDAAWSKSKG